MSTYVLSTLRGLRTDRERQAEIAVAAALSALEQAEQVAADLQTRASEARAALAAARASDTAVETAVDARIRRQFWSRLERALDAASTAATVHRASALDPARRAAAAARAAHAKARQSREVVDKAIARREAGARRRRELQVEAEIDDMGSRRPRR